MVPVISVATSPIATYSGLCYLITTIPIRGFHPLRLDFPVYSSPINIKISQSYNPNDAATSLVWASPISLATTLGITFVFSSYGYLDVSVPRVRSFVVQLLCTGFPHSDTCGSLPIDESPQLFAACRVLLRL
jgi:hypothetical protein